MACATVSASYFDSDFGVFPSLRFFGFRSCNLHTGSRLSNPLARQQDSSEIIIRCSPIGCRSLFRWPPISRHLLYLPQQHAARGPDCQKLSVSVQEARADFEVVKPDIPELHDSDALLNVEVYYGHFTLQLVVPVALVCVSM